MTTTSINPPATEQRRNRVARVASRIAAFAAVWAVLTWSDGWSSWLVGLPAIAAVLVVSRRLGHSPRVEIDLVQVVRFSALFVTRSLQGSWDVARRALHPRAIVTPRLIYYSVRLPPGLPRLLFANTISVLPGSLVASMDGARLTVHLLDGSADPLPALLALERDVAQIFNIDLAEANDE